MRSNAQPAHDPPVGLRVSRGELDAGRDLEDVPVEESRRVVLTPSSLIETLARRFGG